MLTLRKILVAHTVLRVPTVADARLKSLKASVGSNQQFYLGSRLVCLDPQHEQPRENSWLLPGSVGSNQQIPWTRTRLSGSKKIVLKATVDLENTVSLKSRC